MKDIVAQGLKEAERAPALVSSEAAPVQFPPKDLIVHPYVLGCLLGDGSFTADSTGFSNPEKDIVDCLRALLPAECALTGGKDGKDWRVTGMQKYIRQLGLFDRMSHEKYVPLEYLYSAPAQRFALMQGLFDTAGSVTCGGKQLEFCTTSEQLAKDMQFLVESFGGTAVTRKRVTQYTYRGKKQEGRPSYRLTIVLPLGGVPFRSEKHASRYKKDGKYTARRCIVAVEPAGMQEMQCITVDAEDSCI